MPSRSKNRDNPIDVSGIVHKRLVRNARVPTELEVAAAIQYLLTSYKSARLEKEDVWLQCWAAYSPTLQANNFLRSSVLRNVGNVSTGWRHRIDTGMAFSLVETINSYLQDAFFPNRDWFNAIPRQPGYADLVKAIKKITHQKLVDGNFYSVFDQFIRQMLVIGTSVLALPWRYEARAWKKRITYNSLYANVTDPVDMDEVEKPGYKKQAYKEVTEDRVVRNHPEFETLDMFDCFLDPDATSPNEGNFIRRLVRTRAEIIHEINSGLYYCLEPIDVVRMKCCQKSPEKEILTSFQGMSTDPYSMSDGIEVIEFWGDLHLSEYSLYDICATVIDGTLVSLIPNPYWGGKPFVIGTYIPMIRSPYGIGCIEPSLGILHELNIITNQRLDNLELYGNLMFSVTPDSGLDPDDVYSAPGKVFFVENQDTIKPIQMPSPTFINYNEHALLEQRIEKITGAGAFINVGFARDAERVTAEEVAAIRNAGGARLASVHKHIEQTALFPILQKVYRLLQQFVVDDEIVRIVGRIPGTFEYVAVGSVELQNDFILQPVGADHLSDEKNALERRLQFLKIVSENPIMSQYVNYYEFMVDLARRFGIEDIEGLIADKTLVAGQTQPSSSPQDPQQQLMSDLYDMGGVPMQQAVKANLQVDGGQKLAQDMYGVDMTTQPIP